MGKTRRPVYNCTSSHLLNHDDICIALHCRTGYKYALWHFSCVTGCEYLTHYDLYIRSLGVQCGGLRVFHQFTIDRVRGLINQPVKNHCITTVEWEIISICIPLLIEHWLQPKPNQVPHLSLYNVSTDMKLNRNQQVTLCGLRSPMMYHHLGLFLLLDSVKDAYTKFLWVPNKYLAFILRGNTPTKLSCI